MQEIKRLSPPGTDPTEKQIEKHILTANEVAQQAVQRGHHPFGAILVDADNETVLMSQENVDTVNHAESTLTRLAAAKYSPEHLWQCTLYSTVEPCVMCAGTLYWANIGRLAYGMSERQLLDFTGAHAENPTMDVSCRYVFAHSQKAIKVWGPVAGVVDQITELHRDFWRN
jgi:tRNA(Arg) A34 adenosine deaminase TadA